MKLRYAGRCRTCGQSLDPGTEAVVVKGVGVYCNDVCRRGPQPARAFTPPGDDREVDGNRLPSQPAATPEALVRRHLDALWNELKARK